MAFELPSVRAKIRRIGDGQARYLRNNSTTPEILLWNKLKEDQIGFQFRRQRRFGPFILDLYCPSVKLNVEIDGKDHAWREKSDEDRDAYLTSENVFVIRIPARAVFRDCFAVAMRIQAICEYLKKSETPPNELLY